MNKVIGFALIFAAVGMLAMLIIPNDFLGFLILCALFVIGVCLFKKDCK